MGTVYRGAAFLAAALLPAVALAQQERPAAEAEAAESSAFETEDGWGIVEHDLRVAPVDAEQPQEAMSADLPERPGPEWPNEHLERGWDYASAYSFPQLYPNVAARNFTIVGDAGGGTNFVNRIEAELYLLHFGVNAIESVGGNRTDRAYADFDLRIPISLGGSQRLAIMPGVSFPIDEGDKTEETTNVRAQAIWGAAGGGLGLQLRGGVTEGSRPAGLVDIGERIDNTAALWGALASWRVAPVAQLRVEASGEVAAEGGAPDRLTLLPGVVFFPWSDARLHVGLSAVVETVGEGLDEDPVYGGLLDLGIFFL